MIEQKIVEIKGKYTLLKGVVVENESDTHTVWLVVGNQQFVLEGYHSIEEGEWMREILAKAILALIASEHRNDWSKKVPEPAEPTCFNCDSPKGKILPICHKCFDVLKARLEPAEHREWSQKVVEPQAEMMPLDIYAVAFSNYDPIEINSLWWTKSDADKKAIELGSGWEVIQISIQGENTHDQQVSQAAVKEFAEKEKLIWYILDEIACKHSATHVGSGKTPCPICDRVEEAMRLGLYKPTPEECTKLYNSRRKV
jgi:hypothetical protein